MSRTHPHNWQFPSGDETDLDIHDFPVTTDGFKVTEHFEQRCNRTNPIVSDAVLYKLLNDSIVRGQPKFENEESLGGYRRYLLQREISGYWSCPLEDRIGTDEDDYRTYEWTLVVADDKFVGPDEQKWVLVTIYSDHHGSRGTTQRYFERKQNQESETETKYSV